MHFGNLHDLYSKGLTISVARCQGKDAGCKSEEEIEEFVDNLIIDFFHNDIKYEANKFDGEPSKGYIKEDFKIL